MKRILSTILIIALLSLSVGCRDKSTTSSLSSLPLENDTSSLESSVTSDTVSPETPSSVPTDASSTESIPEEPKEEPIPLYPMPEISPAPALNEGDFTINLSFTGDMILAQYLNCPHPDAFGFYNDNYPNSYFLEEVKHIFTNDDFTVVNLENVLSDRELEPIPKNYTPAFWFKSRTSNIEILKSAGVEAVNLNNNHTGDFGSEGLADTISTVTNAGMQYGNNNNTILFEKNGFRVAVVCVGLWREASVPLAVNILNRAKQVSDYQIVFFHGGTEKIHLPENEKIRGARALVDNGADLVIGSHPHVLQPREFYNGVEIVYSLGNFCYGGSRVPENRTVIYTARLTVNNQNQLLHKSSELIPCFVYTGRINNYRPVIISDPTTKQRVLDFMDNKRTTPF
ncbi:MAG: CapA family protein [Ruminococcaceae bacterium]|nr:CapA family protein [Oscillospiraceae bacterium]